MPLVLSSPKARLEKISQSPTPQGHLINRKIFNQCNNKKLVKHKSKMSTSFEMQEVSTSDDEKKSVQSLPIANTTYKSYNDLNRVDFVNSSSRRNLNF
ncbi:unnamed protein product [Plutella xylostella]|uniref:(diamondback moth) hypothetical protein n=1 Tax=Plutella xylostella TaxID=51655 RepID=A0A8S4E3A4_PLUXY|nr:unnamed protein product [Plutella xylostella]